MTRKVYLIIGIGVLAVVGLLWFAFGSAKLRQYEVISDEVFYRAAVSSLDEFVDVEAKVSPAYVMIGMHEHEQEVEPWASIIGYAGRNQIPVAQVAISSDGTLPNSQVDMVLPRLTSGKRFPVLFISADGAYGGMVAAAYRLNVEKMPLDEVEKLAALPDAPADTTRRIREFARAYGKTHSADSNSTPTTAPATNAATN